MPVGQLGSASQRLARADSPTLSDRLSSSFIPFLQLPSASSIGFDSSYISSHVGYIGTPDEETSASWQCPVVSDLREVPSHRFGSSVVTSAILEDLHPIRNTSDNHSCNCHGLQSATTTTITTRLPSFCEANDGPHSLATLQELFDAITHQARDTLSVSRWTDDIAFEAILDIPSYWEHLQQISHNSEEQWPRFKRGPSPPSITKSTRGKDGVVQGLKSSLDGDSARLPKPSSSDASLDTVIEQAAKTNALQFVHYTIEDGDEIMTSVSPSGSYKTKMKREQAQTQQLSDFLQFLSSPPASLIPPDIAGTWQ